MLRWLLWALNKGEPSLQRWWGVSTWRRRLYGKRAKTCWVTQSSTKGLASQGQKETDLASAVFSHPRCKFFFKIWIFERFFSHQPRCRRSRGKYHERVSTGLGNSSSTSKFLLLNKNYTYYCDLFRNLMMKSLRVVLTQITSGNIIMKVLKLK